MADYHPWLHRYATMVAFCTFLLIVAGALVTGNGAGLAELGWPTGGPFRLAELAGGVKIEHAHRMIAGAVGVLTLILAVWLWRQDSRGWVRWTAFAAVAAVLAQVALGGVSVLWFLPVAISTAHAALGQIFFCLAVSLAVFTGADWSWNEDKLEDPTAPSLRLVSAATTGAILLDLVMGAVYRHSSDGTIVPHVVVATVVTLLGGWVVFKVLRRFVKHPGLLHPALLLGGLLAAQIFLGIGSLIMTLATRNDPLPVASVIDVTTAHVTVGALALVTSLYVTFQAYRFLIGPRQPIRVAPTPHHSTT